MPRRLLPSLLALALLAAIVAFWQRGSFRERAAIRDANDPATPTRTKALPSTAAPAGATNPAAPQRALESLAGSSSAQPEPPSELADGLNAPDGSVSADLKLVHEIFAAWLTNFREQGIPIGENRDVTAALTGANPLSFAFVPRNHPAINARGELCDRWGTPFRFHPLSRQQMELRSAGPDRKFGTPDDAEWAPWPRNF